ncbi:DUF4844 domain-containing protein [Hydrogenophaga sp. RWCD_12]|uniref:DUF4844 domain-containing protein n=1 Tax=Hydrogenophaga sp. RWCD_12 TaxID=3391190 RepID=UPI00398515FA
MPTHSRRALLLSTLLGAASLNAWARPAGQGMTPDERREALGRFIAKKKFVKEPFYPVDLDEPDRLRYESWVNQLAHALRRLAPSRQTKPVVLGMFKPVMKKFDTAEVEDQDRFLLYLDELMEIFGIESSDGLLSQWRHGVDPRASMEARNAQALAAMTPDQRALLDRLQGMTATNAEATLRSVLGAPQSETEVLKVWSLPNDPASSLGLSIRGHAVMFIWMLPNGHVYGRRL